MIKIKRFRLGNVELRPLDDRTHAAEILKWRPNEFYGKEGGEYERVQGGYRLKGNPDGMLVHKSCFEYPETCCVVAFINENCDVVSVGKRPWELDEDDADSFKRIIDYIYEMNRE